MEYYVANSYKNMKRIGEPFEKNGKLYTMVEATCDRCYGTGYYGWGAVINGHTQYGGTCFKCHGAGKIQKSVRLYTEKEHAAQERARLKREAEKEEREREREAKAFPNWLSRNGFNEDEYTFIIYGNTYPIKDELKAQGFKFSQELKWHGPAAVEVPEDCFIEKVHWTDIYEWNGRYMVLTDEGKDFLNGIFMLPEEATFGEYIGEVGERLRNIEVTFIRMIEFNGKYGLARVYRFDYEGHALSWFTEVDKDLEEGDTYILSGTVKDHKLYGNERITYLNRCIIK